MEAQTLNCPNCGAASSSEAPLCIFCESRLATIACPSCFGMMFIGSRHCPHCGAAAAARAENTDATPLKCPRCGPAMTAVAIGSTSLSECAQCSGLWVEASALEKICAEREQQAAVLGTASIAAHHQVNSESVKVRYVPCPRCSQLMNRINFARCSGVVVDVCKGHGTWFDADELRRIVEFIRAGGLEGSRAREKHEIEEERRQLRSEQLAAARHATPFGKILDLDEGRASGVSATGGLLKFLLD